MDAEDLLARLIAQIEQIEQDLRGLQADGDSPGGSLAIVGQTFTEGTYPTAAGQVYAVHPCTLAATETEGAGVTVTVPGSASVVHALNLGGSIPAAGSPVICRCVGSRWTFRYG